VVSGDVFKVMGASLVQCSGVAARVAALRCARLALTGLVLRDPVPSHTGQITGMHVHVPAAGASPVGHRAAAAARRALILAVHDRSSAAGLPPGGLHPTGAGQYPEREPSRAWSGRDFQDALAVQNRDESRGVRRPGRGRGQRILEPLDGSRGGLILPRRVKVTSQPSMSCGPPAANAGHAGTSTSLEGCDQTLQDQRSCRSQARCGPERARARCSLPGRPLIIPT
jgi:hypothetical protein